MSDDAEKGAPQMMPHFEDVNAPLIYADDCFGGGLMVGGNITLTFAAKILNHTQSPPVSHSKTVLRLVIPAVSAGAMADFVKQLLANIERGSAPAAANTKLN